MRTYSPQEIEAAAILAREDLYFFSRWMFLQRRNFKWMRGPHHKLICEALMRVFNGETQNLLINIAPRYSKTEIAVVNFMAWALGHHPDSEFIHASYGAELATNNSWNVRELVQHPAYHPIFPGVGIRADSNAKDHWRTTAGGVVFATGAGGAMTGYGAGKLREGFGGAIILDDPHKAAEARSDTKRQSVIDWFQNTVQSRRNSPHTPIIVIMQRLHENDLAGWLLNGGDGEDWEHLCIKTLQDDGTALWPEKHDATMLRRMQKAAPYTFAGQYQQAPAPPEGNIFKPGSIRILDAIPEGTRFVRAWDLAASDNQESDWTAGPKLGIQPNGRWLIADMVRFQGGPEVVDAEIKNTARRDGVNVRIRLPQDPGQAGKTQAAYLTKMLAGFPVKCQPVSGDKITRAEPFAAQVNAGNVDMLRAPWNDALVSEMRLFPNVKHDDQIDGLSDAFAELNFNSHGILDHMANEAADAMEAAARLAAGLDPLDPDEEDNEDD